MASNNVYMLSVQHPKPLSINQEITNYAVAASKLLNLLCLIIEASAHRARKKAGKDRIQETEYRILKTT
jgi:hypothetical protein